MSFGCGLVKFKCQFVSCNLICIVKKIGWNSAISGTWVDITALIEILQIGMQYQSEDALYDPEVCLYTSFMLALVIELWFFCSRKQLGGVSLRLGA